MPGQTFTLINTGEFTIGVLVGQNKKEKAIATVFRNGDSPAAFELPYRVDADMLAQVYDNEQEWDKVQDAIRVAQLALQTQEIPA